jgi:hypothetical protein
VGNALAFLKARARKIALLAALQDTKSNSHRREPLDYSFCLDGLTCQLATEILRPLGEGLAIAVEQDALTRKSPYLSNPFLTAARAFAPPDVEEPILGFLTVDKVLALAREGAAGVRRKLNVYGDRVGPDGNGYLLGYLAVRWMMRELGSKETRLIEESDLVLGFLRSFFYDDWQLVDILLERDTNEIALANAIMGHIRERFETLTTITPDDVRQYESCVSEGRWGYGNVDSASFLHYDAGLGQRGVERVTRLVDEINSYPEAGNADVDRAYPLLRSLDAELLSTRSVVDVGSCEVNVKVRSGTCTVILGDKIIIADVATDAGDQETSGTIDVCYDTESGTHDRFLAVAVPDGLIAVVAYGPGQVERRLPDLRMSRTELRNRVGVFDQVLDAVLDKEFGLIISLVMDKAPERISYLYLDPALSNVKDEHVDNVLALLGAGGLRAVLDGRRDLAEALAVIGAACGPAPFRGMAAGALKRRGLEVGLLDELVQLGGKGLPLVAAADSWLYTFV